MKEILIDCSEEDVVLEVDINETLGMERSPAEEESQNHSSCSRNMYLSYTGQDRLPRSKNMLLLLLRHCSPWKLSWSVSALSESSLSSPVQQPVVCSTGAVS